MKYRIFISSVQREFAKERKALASYIRKDAILGKFFEVFLFEEVPAQERKADGVYLAEVDACDIYLGIFGHTYGNVDSRASRRLNGNIGARRQDTSIASALSTSLPARQTRDRRHSFRASTTMSSARVLSATTICALRSTQRSPSTLRTRGS